MDIGNQTVTKGVLVMTLGERIKECRLNAKLSQEKVAELVGVSRQAVTKWESNQSAPNTENLFKLAEIFGTTVDLLLKTEDEPKQSPAEQIYYLYKLEEEKKRKTKKEIWKRNFITALVVVTGYLAVYFVGRILWCDISETTVLGWLFFAQPLAKGSYLYGWLLHRNWFWFAMLVSVVAAAFGKKKFSVTTFGYFVIGMLLGILLGPTEYGTGEYGWAYWGGIYLISIPIGIVLEKCWRQDITLKSKTGKLLASAMILSIIIMTILVWILIPDWKMQ